MEENPKAIIVGPFRFFEPYMFAFTCKAKGRWINRTLLDAYTEEFKSLSKEEIESRIKNGRIKVNDEAIPIDYIVKQHDVISQSVLRTESPVYNKKIEIIGETDEFIAVFKPHSIPIHAAGGYIYNSLMKQLETRYFPVHRLDRVTSGIIVMGKTNEAAKKFTDLLNDGKISKTYVARVIGVFPEEEVTVDAPIIETKETRGRRFCGEGGKESKTIFKRIATNGKESIVECKPITGRTHQIRAHLAHIGFPITNDEMYGGTYIGLTDEEEKALIEAKERGILAKEVEREWKVNELTFMIFLSSVHYKSDCFDFVAQLPEWTNLDIELPEKHVYKE